jgi:chromosome segregation ATPase
MANRDQGKKISAGALSGERQDEIRARIQQTLDASRLTAKPSPASGAAGADPAARMRALEARQAELEQELAAERLQVTEIGARLEEARAAHAALAKDKALAEEALATARRRLEGYAEETTSLRQKMEALERVLARITSHRWYRAWDRMRMILGKPSLHGPRKDPLGIKSVTPG